MFKLMNLHEYSYTTSILVSKENIPFIPEAPFMTHLSKRWKLQSIILALNIREWNFAVYSICLVHDSLDSFLWFNIRFVK